MKQLFLLLTLSVLPASFTQIQGAEAAAPSFEPMGFCTVAAYGVNGTTGGGDVKPTIVHNAAELQTACERLDLKNNKERANTPRVILVANDIDLGVLANQKPGTVMTNVGVVRVQSDTTLYSVDGATIRRCTIEVHGAHNIIIRNLKFRDLWELDPTGKYDRFGWDSIRIVSSGPLHSHHVWVDHCDFGKAYDGQCDITHGSDCITVSWCHFAGDERGPHKKSMLIGHSSSANAAAMDRGHLNVTIAHNWFENIDDRTPRARFGNIHALNNFIDGAQNANISVDGAVTLVEGCVYHDVKTATTFAHASDTAEKDRAGVICIVDSKNLSPRAAGTPEKKSEREEIDNNFKSNVERAKLAFNKPADFAWADLNNLPYRYTADPADAVPDLVKKYAGVGKIKLP